MFLFSFQNFLHDVIIIMLAKFRFFLLEFYYLIEIWNRMRYVKLYVLLKQISALKAHITDMCFLKKFLFSIQKILRDVIIIMLAKLRFFLLKFYYLIEIWNRMRYIKLYVMVAFLSMMANQSNMLPLEFKNIIINFLLQ